jgi:hypothetical protein
MFNTNEKIYKYIGLGFIGIILFYLILRTLKFQLNVIEGLTSASASASAPVSTDVANTPSAISNNSTAVEDTLLINKYRQNYEDIIIALDKNIDFCLLQNILKNAESISANPLSTDALTIINSINALKQFKDSLNEGMSFMNTVSSGGSDS